VNGFIYVGGIAADQSGNIFISDTGDSRIRKFDSNGNLILTWGSYHNFPLCSPQDGTFYWPQGVAVDQSGNVYVADTQNNRVQKFDNNGNFLTKWGNFTIEDSQFFRPEGVAVDQSGHLFVADTSNNRIKKYLSSLPSGVFLNSITDAAGRITTFGYENYRVSTITDPIGRQASFTYDNGHLETQTDMAGIVTTYEYNPQSYMTQIITPQGPTVLGYLSNAWYHNLLSTITDPLGNQRGYGVCQPPVCWNYGDVSITDARGNPLYYHHDDAGCGSKNLKDAMNNTTSFGYDGNCNRTSITNPNTYTTTIGYNSHGDITFIKDPVCADLGCQTTFTYWSDQTYLKEIIDPRNNNYKYTFEYSQDGKWNLRFITDPLSRITEFRYHPSGNGLLSEFIDARLNKTTFTNNSHGDLETVTGPTIGSPPYSLTTTYGYDNVSRLTSITDPRGNITRYEYDGIDRITKITYPDGKTVEYTYFCCGQSSVKDENGKTTTYQPDADNRIRKVFDPGGGVTEYQYDGNGNIRYLIDAEGQTTEFTYDPLNRLKTITYPEGTPVEEFDYYPVGTPLWKKSRKPGQTNYVYNKNNRLTSLSSPNISIGYGYDKAGNKDWMADVTGSTDFEYDELNRLKYVIYPGGKRIDYSYNEVGNLETITTAFGIVTYDYDAYNRLSRITLPNQSVIDYHYDENNYKGNLTSVHYPNGTYTTYGYDTRNRLVSLTNNGPGGIISQYTYTLDGVGNKINVSVEEPLSWTLPVGSVGYNYVDGNFLTSAGPTTYNYDPNGNLNTRTQGTDTSTYTFDSQDRLTNISSSSFNFQYQYDGLFNRVTKTINGSTTRYLVDPNGFLPQVIAEMDDAYNITSYYVYNGISLVAKISGSNVYYYHYDGLANTIAMTDAAGNMVNKYAYDEFRNLLNAVETVPNPFTFVGQYGVMDDDSGLLHMRARYYDPEVGRFISKDPIRYLGGVNLFSYVANNPINWADPLGLIRAVFNAGGHIWVPMTAGAGGVNFSSEWWGLSYYKNEYKGMSKEFVIGSLVDVGVSTGISGLSGCSEGKERSLSINVPWLGKYAGFQFTFKGSKLDAITVGYGRGLSLPATFTIPWEEFISKY